MKERLGIILLSIYFGIFVISLTLTLFSLGVFWYGIPIVAVYLFIDLIYWFVTGESLLSKVQKKLY